MITENGINYIDKEVHDSFCNNVRPIALYRYMDYKRLERGKLRFSNPLTEWEDPYEKLFLNSTYNGKPNPLINRVFCMCFTTSNSSEAAWKVYKCTTKFTVKTDCFIKILQGCSEDYEIYIGRVEYKSQTDLKRCSISKLTGLYLNDFQSSGNEAWVKLLLLKRIAFEYENEIRVFIIPKRNLEMSGNELFLKYSVSVKELFPHVELSPVSISLDNQSLSSPQSHDYNTEKVCGELQSKFEYAPEQISKSSLYEPVSTRHFIIRNFTVGT